MKVEKGRTVWMHYTGTLDDGTVFDTSEGKEPLEFVFGEGSIIPALEAQLERVPSGFLYLVDYF